jgi:GT2 family glycosyltransferase
VRLFHFDRRHYPGEARNYGVEHAQGDVLVFLDADCRVTPDWLAKIFDTHARVDVIGSAIANGNPESLVSWAHYLFEFSQWLPSGAPRFVEDLAGGGLSLKRAVFERYGPFPAGVHSQDTVLIWRLREAGHRLWLDPANCVLHHHETSARSLLAGRLVRGRHFASVRVEEKALGLGRRCLLIAGSPLLPFVLFARGRGEYGKPASFARGSCASGRWCSLRGARGRAGSCWAT